MKHTWGGWLEEGVKMLTMPVMDVTWTNATVFICVGSVKPGTLRAFHREISL